MRLAISFLLGAVIFLFSVKVSYCQPLQDNTEKYFKKSLEFYFSYHSGLPEDIVKYTELESLTVVGNPDWNWDTTFVILGLLTKLKKLTLNSDQLKHLPPSISYLTNLEELDLRKNNLISLPLEIIMLKNLKSVSLDWNHDLDLDSLFILLSSLKIKNLSISFCDIHEIPSSIGKIRSLESLALSGNSLQTLPADLKGLNKLNSISLEENCFNNPEQLLNLPGNLKYLGLTANKFTGEGQIELQKKYHNISIVF